MDIDWDLMPGNIDMLLRKIAIFPNISSMRIFRMRLSEVQLQQIPNDNALHCTFPYENLYLLKMHVSWKLQS